jgi:hypothetical protein
MSSPVERIGAPSSDTSPNQARVNEFTFAVGHEGRRVSSTWMVKWGTRLARNPRRVSLDLFVFNVDAGADKGHLSYHGAKNPGQDWIGHWKAGRSTDLHKSEPWDWPAALPESEGTLYRFAAVIVPHISLEEQPPGPVSTLKPKLLSAPAAGQQLSVDIFLELGRDDPDCWPGKNSKGTELVTQRVIAIHDTEGKIRHAVGRWVLVSHQAPQGPLLERGVMTFPAPHDPDRIKDFIQAAAGRPRMVLFGKNDLDGGIVPWIAEVPVADIRWNPPTT